MVTLLKVGGSAITHKDVDFSPRYDIIESVASQIADSKVDKLVIGNGGGSYGHYVATKYNLKNGITNGEQKYGLALAQDAVARLNRLLVSALLNNGVNAIGMQPSAFMCTNNGEIESVLLEPIEIMLERGIYPVVYGDTVLDKSKGTTILSTEVVLNELAKKLKVKRMIVGCTVDGVMEDLNGGKLIPEVNKDNFQDIRRLIGAAEGYDVTGGMRHKVEQMIELAKAGVNVEMINITKPDILKRCLCGESGLGTVIRW